MRDSWYYSVPEGQVGPITLEELKHTLPTLPNAQDVHIWHESLPDWIRAGDLADIVAKANVKAGAVQPTAGQDDVVQDEDAAHVESPTRLPKRELKRRTYRRWTDFIPIARTHSRCLPRRPKRKPTPWARRHVARPDSSLALACFFSGVPF